MAPTTATCNATSVIATVIANDASGMMITSAMAPPTTSAMAPRPPAPRDWVAREATARAPGPGVVNGDLLTRHT